MNVMMFPGQGSQHPAMFDGIPTDFTKPLLEQASEILGYDMAEMVASGDERLGQTTFTQPALLTASVAWHEYYKSAGGPAPDLMFGHSLGEYSALVAGAAIAFEDAVRLTSIRGQAMQNAVAAGEGAMAALIGGSEAEAERMCADARGENLDVWPANFNSPKQVVVAGTAGAVDHLKSMARDYGFRRVIPIKISVPSHCPLMAPAAEQVAAELETIQLSLPKIPLWHNATTKAATSIDGLKVALQQQLTSPVRFSTMVQQTSDDAKFVECGPSAVLTGLIGHCRKGAYSQALSAIESAKHVAQAYSG